MKQQKLSKNPIEDARTFFPLRLIRLNKKLLILLPMLFMIVSDVFANDEYERVIANLGVRLLIILIVILFFWITRLLLTRRMSKLMMKQSRKTTSEFEYKTEEDEVLSKVDLKMTEVDFETSREASQYSGKLISDANKRAWYLLIAQLAILAGYTIIGWSEGFRNLYAFFWDGEDYKSLLIIIAIWNIVQFIGFRLHTIAYKKVASEMFKPVWNLIFWVFNVRWSLFMSVILAFLSIFFVIDGNPIFIIAVVIHAVVFGVIVNSGLKRDNVKLLILRVFSIDKTSNFTFKRLVTIWKYFGLYFTVADPVFYKINWKGRFNYNFPIFIISLLVFVSLVTWPIDNPEELWAALGVLVFVLIIFLFIYVSYSIIKLKGKYVSNQDQLEKRLQKLQKRPTKYDKTFKEFPVMCFDNTWKLAVHVLANTADVILMDLRGYSDSNKGCEYEVDFLFDMVAVERIVFLAHRGSVPRIESLLKEQWKYLVKSSPNLHTKSPVATIYIADKEKSKDVQGVIDVLISKTN